MWEGAGLTTIFETIICITLIFLDTVFLAFLSFPFIFTRNPAFAIGHKGFTKDSFQIVNWWGFIFSKANSLYSVIGTGCLVASPLNPTCTFFSSFWCITFLTRIYISISRLRIIFSYTITISSLDRTRFFVASNWSFNPACTFSFFVTFCIGSLGMFMCLTKSLIEQRGLHAV